MTEVSKHSPHPGPRGVQRTGLEMLSEAFAGEVLAAHSTYVEWHADDPERHRVRAHATTG